jgi:hypothetical protein
MEEAQYGPPDTSEIDDLWDTIAALAAIKTAAEAGHAGGTKTQENRIGPQWPNYVKEQIVARKLTGASNTDIHASFARRGGWGFRGRKCPSRSTFMALLKQFREDGTLPPGKQK